MTGQGGHQPGTLARHRTLLESGELGARKYLCRSGFHQRRVMTGHGRVHVGATIEQELRDRQRIALGGDAQRRAGARGYAEDLAGNKAELYGRTLSEDPPDLPANCRELTVDEPVPDAGLMEPAAFAWCWHGVFSVAVTAVGPTVDDALAEVSSVMGRQLAQLPPG